MSVLDDNHDVWLDEPIRWKSSGTEADAEGDACEAKDQKHRRPESSPDTRAFVHEGTRNIMLTRAKLTPTPLVMDTDEKESENPDKEVRSF